MLTSPLALLRQVQGAALSVPLPEQVSEKSVLVGVCRAIEARVSVAHPGDIVVACLQHRRHLTPLTRKVYRRIAEIGVPVVLVGEGMDGEDRAAWPGDVRPVALPAGHPLTASWIVTANTADPYCFVAEERPTGRPVDDGRRTFAWATSEAPDLVGKVTAAVLAHLV